MTNKYQHAAQAPAPRMIKTPNNKPVYDREKRTCQFAKAVRFFIKIVWVISIWNLRFVWNLMLEFWDFKDSVNGYDYGTIIE